MAIGRYLAVQMVSEHTIRFVHSQQPETCTSLTAIMQTSAFLRTKNAPPLFPGYSGLSLSDSLSPNKCTCAFLAYEALRGIQQMNTPTKAVDVPVRSVPRKGKDTKYSPIKKTPHSHETPSGESENLTNDYYRSRQNVHSHSLV